MRQGRRIACWLLPEQAWWLRDAARAAEADVILAGSPARGQSQGVASELEAEPVDDLRGLLATAEAELLVIGAPDTFGAGSNRDEPVAVAAAAQRGLKIATVEPIPATALDLFGAGWLEGMEGSRPVDGVRFLPRLVLSPPLREAVEVLQNFGHIRLVSVEAWCRALEGTLGARLLDGLDLVLSLLGEPEVIDAAYVAPNQGQGMHVLPGETLRGLHGDLSANLRFADGRAASLAISDQGGRWNRTVTLIGPAGRLRFFDDGFEWLAPDGRKVDESRKTRERGASPSHAVAAAADSIARILDPGTPESPPPDHVGLLAMCQAALLSARTGQPESPATIRRMAGVV
jgi:hypothetical protein